MFFLTFLGAQKTKLDTIITYISSWLVKTGKEGKHSSVSSSKELNKSPFKYSLVLSVVVHVVVDGLIWLPCRGRDQLTALSPARRCCTGVLWLSMDVLWLSSVELFFILI